MHSNDKIIGNISWIFDRLYRNLRSTSAGWEETAQRFADAVKKKLTFFNQPLLGAQSRLGYRSEGYRIIPQYRTASSTITLMRVAVHHNERKPHHE